MIRQSDYDFRTTWTITAPRHRVSTAIQDMRSWPTWWPGLRSVEVKNVHKKIVGSRVHMAWGARLGYTLRIEITITNYMADSRIDFTSVGDLVGGGSWSLKDGDQIDTTAINILWHVATTKRWMNISAPLLRPIFIFNHYLLMRAGQKGLRHYLKDK